jgi:hypothetical protein
MEVFFFRSVDCQSVCAGRAKYFDTEKLTTFSLNFKLRLLNGHILVVAE